MYKNNSIEQTKYEWSDRLTLTITYMQFNFKELYAAYDKDELYVILSHQEDYQPDAVNAAWEVAVSKGWQKELTEKLNIKKANEEENVYEESRINEILSEGCFIEVSRNNIIEIEAALIEHNIEYAFLEKNNVKNPGRFYYFYKSDFDAAKKLLG